MRGRAAAPGWLLWLLSLAWMALIFLLSAQPDFEFVPEAWQPEPVALAAHAFVFGVLAGLLWLAARRTPAVRDHAAVLAFTVAVLYGLSDEFHQYFVPGRTPDPVDLVADATGAALVLWWLRRRSSVH